MLTLDSLLCRVVECSFLVEKMENKTREFGFILCGCGLHGIIVYPDFSVSPRLNNVEEVEAELDRAEAQGKVTHEDATTLWFQASDSKLPACASGPESFSDLMMKESIYPANYPQPKQIVH